MSPKATPPSLAQIRSLPTAVCKLELFTVRFLPPKQVTFLFGFHESS